MEIINEKNFKPSCQSFSTIPSRFDIILEEHICFLYNPGSLKQPLNQLSKTYPLVEQRKV